MHACEICGDEPVAVVASVPGIPYSAGFGRHCIDASMSTPYWLLVANTASIGGLEHAAEWWIFTVTDHLDHMGWSPERFGADVVTEILHMENDFA